MLQEFVQEDKIRQYDRELKSLSDNVSADIFYAALALCREPAYKGRNKKEHRKIRRTIFHAARIAYQTNFPSKSDSFMKVYYWTEAYLASGLNVPALEKCISSIDEEILAELEGEDAYEVLCVECDKHDSCHSKEV